MYYSTSKNIIMHDTQKHAHTRVRNTHTHTHTHTCTHTHTHKHIHTNTNKHIYLVYPFYCIYVHRYLYWSVAGPGGGIFQLHLTLAKAASCFSSAVGAVNILLDYAANGIYSMSLNLEDSLIYFTPGGSHLSSISLGEKVVVNYTHISPILDARSIASYYEYLVVPVKAAPAITGIFGLFIQIRPPESTAVVEILGNTSNGTSHVYMMREELQPLPGS